MLFVYLHVMIPPIIHFWKQRSTLSIFFDIPYPDQDEQGLRNRYKQ